MHTPEIKSVENSLGQHFEEILSQNWKEIYNEEKFSKKYLDGEKEITYRFRVKSKDDDKILLEVEKEIIYDLGEEPVKVEEVIVKI